MCRPPARCLPGEALALFNFRMSIQACKGHMSDSPVVDFSEDQAQRTSLITSVWSALTSRLAISETECLQE